MEKTNTKADTSENGSRMHINMEAQEKREKNLFPLRIDERTVIYVPKSKRNSDYAESYRKKISQQPVKLGGK